MGQRGFTLIEMLVALAIFAVISAAGLSVMSFASRENGPLVEASAKLQELQIARTVLRGDFGQIAARPVRSEYGARALDGFQGGFGFNNGALLAFVRRGWDNPGGLEPRSSLQHVTYFLEDGELRRVARPVLDPTPDTPEENVTLLRGVESLNISYFSNGQWSERWASRAGGQYLPSVIAIDAEIDGIGFLRQLFLTPGAT